MGDNWCDGLNRYYKRAGVFQARCRKERTMNKIQAAIKTLAEDNEMTAGMKADTDILTIEPKTAAQEAVLENTASRLLHYGGWNTGKKYIGVAKAVMMAQMYPNNYVALIRNKRVDMRATLWKTLERIVEFGSEISSAVKHSAGGMVCCELSNGSRIYGYGMDKDRGRMERMEFGFALIGDAIDVSEEDYNFICSRTRLQSVPFRQVMAITYPEYDDHYLYREFLEYKQEDCASIRARRILGLPQSFYDRMNELNKDGRQRYKFGNWVKRPKKTVHWEADSVANQYFQGKHSKCIRDADGWVIANVLEEHADLMAAAPDLLEAAEKADKLLDDLRSYCHGHDSHTALKQAIAKAKGASNE